MGKGRLEAFSDGVFAIIITIMVLELKVPHGADLDALRPLIPGFLSYALSFVYVAIYWNNHHHMLHVTHKVDGAILWANMHLLFWISLFPITTAWMGENHFAHVPTTVYGVVLLMAAISYTILSLCIIRREGPDSVLAKAVGRDWKGKASLVLYSVAILASLWNEWLAQSLFVTVAIIWLVPDSRIAHAAARTDTR
jgi:uncharacterized membrane protein